ncbi:MAG: ROK family protein [Planctomycetia bacterium]|nr:ROK family protein [Planctomycetia bacterium]
MRLVAGIDLGGTAINYTFLDEAGHFRIEGLWEHPARSVDGPDACLSQISDGLHLAAAHAGVDLAEVVAVGLDTPGPATATGLLSCRGSTNFVHPDWSGFDIRGGVERRLGKPVVYLNDGNAAALWGHVSIFGSENRATSLSAIIGTGLGGGVITEGRVVTGRHGFGGELGHVLIPWSSIPGIEGIDPRCNCGRTGDLESLCSLTAIRRTLLPFFTARHPGHRLAALDPADAAKQVRGLAAEGDEMCRSIFQVQARALGLFFDEMINVFDPDALIIGGGAMEATAEFREWFLREVRAGMPTQRSEQAGIPLHVIPNGDTAGARGAALEAARIVRS